MRLCTPKIYDNFRNFSYDLMIGYFFTIYKFLEITSYESLSSDLELKSKTIHRNEGESISYLMFLCILKEMCTTSK